MKIDPATRTVNLLSHLGWSGGTIHQIARVANVPVEWLLYADFDGAYNTRADRHGQAANIGRTVGSVCASLRRSADAEYNGVMSYWLAVAGVR